MRTYSPGFVLRLTVAAIVCVFGAAAGVTLFTIDQVATQTVRALLNGMRDETFGEQMAECEADPTSWRMGEPGRFQTFAYDADTLESANPDAPPIQPDLAERLRAGEERPGWVSPITREWGGAILDQRAESGPCAVLQIMWRPIPRRRDNIRVGHMLALMTVLVVTFVLMMVLAVRPILKRLRKLAVAADGVGQPGEYASMRDDTQDAIGSVSTVLDRANERILGDRAALKEHLANVAHDLRTPLASMQLALEEAMNETDNPAVRQSLDAALDDLVYLDGLTNNLHLASKLERDVGPLDGGHEVDLGRVVDFVLSRYRVLGRRKSIEVLGSRPDDPVLVRCDPSMAQQVIANLVHNAIKYGNPPGHVAVVLEASADRFDLVVIDDGPGVEPDALEKLAQREFRSTEAIRRDEGAGLGLAIAHRVCLGAGFALEFEPNEPNGLRVRVSGPRAG